METNSQQRERWGRMKEIRGEREDLLIDMKGEWCPNDEGIILTPGNISDLSIESADNLLEPEGGWEDYLTAAGVEMFDRLRELDDEMARLEEEEDDSVVAEAAYSHFYR